MILQTLGLYGFRNYEQEFVELSSGVNLFYGDNAQGKTSILEAIYLFIAGGRSFRTTHLQELVREGASYFCLESHFAEGEDRQKLRLWSDGKGRRLFLNDAPCPSLSSLLGLVRGVVLTPEDIELVIGAPAVRRRFLNIHLSQQDPLYVHHLARYHRALEQRNCLLKQQETATLEAWEEEMAISAAYLTCRRGEGVEALSLLAEKVHGALSLDKESFNIHYKGAIPHNLSLEDAQAALRALFAKHRAYDLLAGNTRTGPHRDDLLFSLNDRPIKMFASQGQQRSALASLKFAEWQRLKDLSETPPWMLIDDIGISLDATRQQRLYEQLDTMGQVFLTAPSQTPFAAPFATPITTYRVEEGRCYKEVLASAGG